MPGLKHASWTASKASLCPPRPGLLFVDNKLNVMGDKQLPVNLSTISVSLSNFPHAPASLILKAYLEKRPVTTLHGALNGTSTVLKPENATMWIDLSKYEASITETCLPLPPSLLGDNTLQWFIYCDPPKMPPREPRATAIFHKTEDLHKEMAQSIPFHDSYRWISHWRLNATYCRGGSRAGLVVPDRPKCEVDSSEFKPLNLTVMGKYSTHQSTEAVICGTLIEDRSCTVYFWGEEVRTHERTAVTPSAQDCMLWSTYPERYGFEQVATKAYQLEVDGGWNCHWTGTGKSQLVRKWVIHGIDLDVDYWTQIVRCHKRFLFPVKYMDGHGTTVSKEQVIWKTKHLDVQCKFAPLTSMACFATTKVRMSCPGNRMSFELASNVPFASCMHHQLFKTTTGHTVALGILSIPKIQEWQTVKETWIKDEVNFLADSTWTVSETDQRLYHHTSCRTEQLAWDTALSVYALNPLAAARIWFNNAQLEGDWAGMTFLPKQCVNITKVYLNSSNPYRCKDWPVMFWSGNQLLSGYLDAITLHLYLNCNHRQLTHVGHWFFGNTTSVTDLMNPKYIVPKIGHLHWLRADFAWLKADVDPNLEFAEDKLTFHMDDLEVVHESDVHYNLTHVIWKSTHPQGLEQKTMTDLLPTWLHDLPTIARGAFWIFLIAGAGVTFLYGIGFIISCCRTAKSYIPDRKQRGRIIR